MKLNYNIKTLEAVLTDFHNATGIQTDILDSDFKPLVRSEIFQNDYCKCIQSTADGHRRCAASDRKILLQCRETHSMQMHVCHAGLVDIAVPILNDDTIIGYLILGQMKKDDDFSEIYKKISELNLPFEKMKNYYTNLSYFDNNKINSVANLAVMLSRYILLENIINPYIGGSLKRAANFIDSNLEKPLNVRMISENSDCSVSSLYKNFHKHFGCTVNDYISKKRIEKSIRFLTETDMTIEQISENCGFSSIQYYSKIFKDKIGISPLKFRKNKGL